MRPVLFVVGAVALGLAAARADDLVVQSVTTGTIAESTSTLWYRQPAKEWVEALPVGNGRLGAMVFGGVAREQIQLNEDTIWSGGPQPAMPASIADQLPGIRQLLFDGRYAEGEALARKTLLTVRNGGGSYQTLGDLILTQTGLATDVTGYRRALDLDSGIATTMFASGGVTYRREVFASTPDQVIAVRISADRPGAISLTTGLTRADVTVSASATADAKAGELLMRDSRWPGSSIDASRSPVSGGSTTFASVVRAAADGGRVTADRDHVIITGANAVTFVVAANTDYNRLKPSAPLPLDRTAASMRTTAALKQPYAALRDRAVADQRRLFRRVDLQLSTDSMPTAPTDERLAAVQKGADDPHLIELYFQYGRYLLMGSSRPGGMPANLQGLWNKEMNAPWSADYHININIQMNYWPAEVTNLSETTGPLFDFIDAFAANTGRRLASDFYGAHGFVAHYTTDAWLASPNTGSPQWALWQMAGAWTTRHFMEHYWFTQDKTFLRERAYPIVRDATLFLLDWLVPDPRTSLLVSGPSASPENQFVGPDGGKYSTAMGNSMDQEIAWDTFTNFLAASRELGIHDALTVRVEHALARLALPKIGADGRIMEWSEPFQEAEPGHRHMSHLFGLYPGVQFTAGRTPAFLAAARKTIDARLASGGGHTGWSRAWIISFYARLRDGDQAYANVQALLARSTLTNLFDNHPPFQIDGNFGGTAGIAEMLLQSHDDGIDLLPALPKAWATGRFTGLRARGGFEISATWKDGAIETVTVTSLAGRPLRLRTRGVTREFETVRGRSYTLRGPELK